MCQIMSAVIGACVGIVSICMLPLLLFTRKKISICTSHYSLELQWFDGVGNSLQPL